MWHILLLQNKPWHEFGTYIIDQLDYIHQPLEVCDAIFDVIVYVHNILNQSRIHNAWYDLSISYNEIYTIVCPIYKWMYITKKSASTMVSCIKPIHTYRNCDTNEMLLSSGYHVKIRGSLCTLFISWVETIQKPYRCYNDCT